MSKIKKKALGKGIGALLKNIENIEDVKDGKDLKDENTSDIIYLRIDLLKPNPYQPRKYFTESSLIELADSIKENGIIQPIIAEEGENGFYTIIVGERRFRASKMAGLKTVPVIVRKYSTEEKLEIALVENIQREDLTPLEEAAGYKSLMEIAKLSQDEIAQKVGKKRSTIANSLRLLKLPVEMLEAIDKGDITPGHARAILSVINVSDQQILYVRILDKQLSVREAEAAANALNDGKRSLGSKNKRDRDKAKNENKIPELIEIEQKFIDFFGTKVKIQGNAQKGKIEITYFSLEDLERLMDILGLNK